MEATLESIPKEIFAAYEQDVSGLEILGDRYLCEYLELKQKSAGGVYLAGVDERLLGWQVGRVIKVGTGHRLETPDVPLVLKDAMGVERIETVTVLLPMLYKVGDIIMCESLGHRELLIRGKKFILVNQTNVFGRWAGATVERKS